MRCNLDGKPIPAGDAEHIRAFARFLTMAPAPRKDGKGYTREELVQLREAYVEYGGHEDVVAKIDLILSDPPAKMEP